MGAAESAGARCGDAGCSIARLHTDQLAHVVSFLPPLERMRARLISTTFASFEHQKWTLVAAAVRMHRTEKPVVRPEHVEGAAHMGMAWIGGISTMTACLVAAVAVPFWVFIPAWSYAIVSFRAQNAFMAPFVEAYRLHEQGRQLWEREFVDPTLDDFCHNVDVFLLRLQVAAAATAEDADALDALCRHIAAEQRGAELRLLHLQQAAEEADAPLEADGGEGDSTEGDASSVSSSSSSSPAPPDGTLLRRASIEAARLEAAAAEARYAAAAVAARRALKQQDRPGVGALVAACRRVRGNPAAKEPLGRPLVVGADPVRVPAGVFALAFCGAGPRRRRPGVAQPQQ
eukprot:TRINITY_DN3411_c3_g1_i2.p2 TRINITY_DN3411_c3_g1~~TRINITY_DN3411_c3_g1_i2.p2  ORF type:complete len:367 (+),score=136.17 TRINITY_DN3411_c3_g1_i2:67-1101(+)